MYMCSVVTALGFRLDYLLSCRRSLIFRFFAPLLMVTSIFSISDHIGDAVYMELAMLLAFALFRPLLGHLYSVGPDYVPVFEMRPHHRLVQ